MRRSRAPKHANAFSTSAVVGIAFYGINDTVIDLLDDADVTISS
jgi:hypothetical protein